MLRLFVEAPLRTGEPIPATDGQAHYFGSVMRRRDGDTVLLFNGRDGEWHARAASRGKRAVAFIPEGRVRAQAAEPDLWLAFAPLKRDATDLAVRAATELGVSALLPVMTERTNAGRINRDRLCAIATEAAEQCERLTIPSVDEPVSLDALLDAWPGERILAVALERAGPCAVPKATALLVGPEGGFAPAEVDGLRARRFMSPIHLGPRVLRAETASIAGLTLLQGADWSTN